MNAINNSLNWFEIAVSDFERARKFYSAIYQFDMPETTMGEFRLGFLPVQEGHIGGAIVHGQDYVPAATGTLVYLNGGDDLNDVLKRVSGAGGKVLAGKTLISPEHGYYAFI